MTAKLEGGEWSAAHPGRTLPPGKTRYPFYRRLGGLQGRSGRAENLVPTGIRSRTVQLVVSRYTDWATRPTPSRRYYYQSSHWTDYWMNFLQFILNYLNTIRELHYCRKVSYFILHVSFFKLIVLFQCKFILRVFNKHLCLCCGTNSIVRVKLQLK